VCYMLTDDLIKTDTYRLDLWAGQQLLWGGSFQPSEHGEGRGWMDPTFPASPYTQWGSHPIPGLSLPIFKWGWAQCPVSPRVHSSHP
jgi:hypothetical protein